MAPCAFSRRPKVTLVAVALLLAVLLLAMVPGQVLGQQPAKSYVWVSITSALQRYDATTGALVDVPLSTCNSGCYSTAAGPDDDVFVHRGVTGEDPQILRFDGRTGQYEELFISGHSLGINNITAFTFGPDGHLYLAVQMAPDYNHTIVKVNGATRTLMSGFTPPTSGPIQALTFGPDGLLYAGVASYSGSGSVYRYSSSGVLVSHVVDIPGSSAAGMAFDAEGRLYVPTNEGVNRYNASTGAAIDTFIQPGSGGLTAPVDLHFGPDNNLYVLSQSTRTIFRYDGRTGRSLGRLVEIPGNSLGEAFVFMPPGAAARPEPPAKAAQVTVVQRGEPNVSVRPGELLTITLKISNGGPGQAQRAVLVLPFDPALLEVLDAGFDRGHTWVSALEASSITITTGPLGEHKDQVTAVLRFRVRPSAAQGRPITLRWSLSWQDERGGGQGQSNQLQLLVATAAASSPYAPLTVTRQAPGSYAFHATAFLPGEPLAVWYNRPSGQAVAVGRYQASADGSISQSFSDPRLVKGSGYSLVVYGVWSDITAVGTFDVPE